MIYFCFCNKCRRFFRWIEPANVCSKCSNDWKPKYICSIHGENCPGDDGGFFMDSNHPDGMYPVIGGMNEDHY